MGRSRRWCRRVVVVVITVAIILESVHSPRDETKRLVCVGHRPVSVLHPEQETPVMKSVESGHGLVVHPSLLETFWHEDAHLERREAHLRHLGDNSEPTCIQTHTHVDTN